MFSFLFGRKRKISGKVASSRLKQLLLSDRIACPTEITDSIRGDIVSALSKCLLLQITANYLYLIISLAEYTGSHSDHCCTFFNCNFIISRHTH